MISQSVDMVGFSATNFADAAKAHRRVYKKAPISCHLRSDPRL